MDLRSGLPTRESETLHASKVLVLGARAPAALEWARAFYACGWEVTTGDSLRWTAARFSRTVTRHVALPEPRRDPARWIEAVAKAVTSLGIDLVVPTCEEVFYLGAGLERIPCRVASVPLRELEGLHHKHRFAESTQGWPGQAPESHLLENPLAAARFAPTSREWVFKPVYSRFASRVLISPTTESVMALRPTPEHPWVAQRFVRGREHCSYSILQGGRLEAHACYHPKHRLGRGSGIWFQPTSPPTIRAFVERFGIETGFSGQVAFDFIEDDTGRCFVLECNPRATSGVHLFDDQPQRLVQALLGTGSGDVLLPTPAPRMVGLAMLLTGAARLVLDDGFRRDYAAARDVMVRSGDPGALWGQVPALAEIVGRAVWQHKRLHAAMTSDIEWDGQVLPGA
jgi:hypothetical protein